MDLQHKMAVGIAGVLTGKSDDEKEKALVTYGIEIILNESVKGILILILGICFGKFPLAVLGMVYLLVARNLAGGRHAKSNIMCILISIVSAFFCPLFAIKINIPFVIQIILCLFMSILIPVIVPFDPDGKIGSKVKNKRRIYSLLSFWIALIFVYFIAGRSYINAILVIEMISLGAAVNFNHCK
ncbi:accessory gene regulator B family protein [Eubacterium ruminantium]|uniref:Accessory gene regulator protein AgrB n=2 Tax=Eubacterium ruminantium TaxID=42322 RepID=A0A1T4N8A1_9FIRM|nr:accessory gene regulator B family protein [Eubacterium ruminantium]SCW52116.1 Accessory gene regulator protein AgrB [Eubacterium ruminantium]SDM64512.1 Accessory gene regulator protein AgrB [Eubacterium ruminantium]SJZ75058.1 Accessory gene regulator protein AgrB [Eubacterium ruminantium]